MPRLIGNFPLLPLRTKTRGPAYTLPFPTPPLPANESPDPDSESYDILDEVLALFRANTFFRNFEIQGPADRLLVYGIWFVSDCLTKIKPHAGVREAQKDVMNLALDTNFAIPGDPGWPLNQVRSFFSFFLSFTACAPLLTAPFPDVRSPHGQAGRRAAAAIHEPDAPGARDAVTGEGLRGGRRRQAQQVVAELHQEEVHGQVPVSGRREEDSHLKTRAAASGRRRGWRRERREVDLLLTSINVRSGTHVDSNILTASPRFVPRRHVSRRLCL